MTKTIIAPLIAMSAGLIYFIEVTGDGGLVGLLGLVCLIGVGIGDFS